MDPGTLEVLLGPTRSFLDPGTLEVIPLTLKVFHGTFKVLPWALMVLHESFLGPWEPQVLPKKIPTELVALKSGSIHLPVHRTLVFATVPVPVQRRQDLQRKDKPDETSANRTEVELTERAQCVELCAVETGLLHQSSLLDGESLPSRCSDVEQESMKV
ncbi:hypothetical protein EYF80_033135 [Liparis tanakae]|uniref:Uncharacterized protein n=1 Tax=Liparis tanakae TaxID=230148 RepID=A0A4Z2GSF5_9TELE|nr:hypothetical protein EYF80_033135 [Liparis tanakae]